MKTTLFAAALALLSVASTNALATGATISKQIPTKIRKVALAVTDISAVQGKRRELKGTTQGANRWNIAVNLGSGAGSKTQSLVISTTGTIIDKTPVQIEPKHSGSNGDL